jgi:hypothetical protein
MIKKIAKRGRPTIYSQELATEICDTIASTTKGIKRLCNDNPDWPSQDTIFSWLKTHSDFSEQYAQAKRFQVEVLVDEVIEIADDSSQDYIVDTEGKQVANNANINRARLKIDTRKWIACKLAPRVYGKGVDSTNKPLSLVELMFKLCDKSER